MIHNKLFILNHNFGGYTLPVRSTPVVVRDCMKFQSPCKCWDSIVHVYEWLQTGFGLVTGFTEHLQIVTTSSYTAVAN
jgi:hypothetical protein